jgi:hypothetical protein
MKTPPTDENVAKPGFPIFRAARTATAVSSSTSAHPNLRVHNLMRCATIALEIAGRLRGFELFAPEPESTFLELPWYS